MQKKIEQLIKKGVVIPSPESIEIGANVDVGNISGDSVQIHSGCKLLGGSTRIMAHTRIGYEAPVTIQDCQLGPRVALKGGFFKQSVFLENASAGSGSHVREGCIFEEEANIAHTVGLKQTILFPFVTLGSLINFCDCLMAGGTSRKDHSEVGSAYIHFNFTPNQDKATPSLIGDVPRGVLLDQAPIFLGGQGGLVGPCRIAFGTIAAAGSILRKDVLKNNRIVIEAAAKGGSIPHVPGRYRLIKRTLVNNVLYIGNLIALAQWYRHVRSQFISGLFPDFLHQAVLDKLQIILDERIRRLDQLAGKMMLSIQKHSGKTGGSKLLTQQQELLDNRGALVDSLQKVSSYAGDPALRDQFLGALACRIQPNKPKYINLIRSLDPKTKKLGSQWLQEIVDHTLEEVLGILPSFK